MSSSQKLFDRFDEKKIRTVAIVDLQFGDTGKGKFSDAVAEWADVIARGTGGANAGHTIKYEGNTYVFHLMPAGILRDGNGKLNIIGRGVAFEPRQFLEELSQLEAQELSYNGLRISYNAHLVLPHHIALDRLSEAGKGKETIGTTGRGIGPLYESHVARVGLTVNDLLNKDVFAEKLKMSIESRAALFDRFDRHLVKEVMHQDGLQNGAFWCQKNIFDTDAIIDRYTAHVQKFCDMITDTDQLMRQAVGTKRVLLEGAQGVLLSIADGSYPYVTSSDCSLAGLAQGVGLRTDDIDYTLGIVKAPYMTRVGKGPFPTELGGKEAALRCNGGKENKTSEREQYPDANLNSKHPLEQGIAMRQAGDEYGATTGRPRRTGWLDLPLLRYANQYGSKEYGNQRSTVTLTKVDVLNKCESIKLCVAYKYQGDDYHVGGRLLTRGTELDTAIMDSYVLDRCVPEYIELPGWLCSLGGVRTFSDLPPNLRNVISMIEHRANVKVDVISTGADRDDTIVW